MIDERESTPIKYQEEISNCNNMLEQVITSNGLVVVSTEKNLDTRPFSLVVASKLSTGQPLDEFSMPLMDSVLYVEGQLGQKDTEDVFERSALERGASKIKFFSYVTHNKNKKPQSKSNTSFASTKNGIVLEEVENGATKLKYDTAIIHNFASVSNHFLDSSEKDSIKAIRKLQEKNVAVIVFVENGSKGSALLQSMADVVFEVTRANNYLDAPINVACVKYPSFQIDPPKPFCLSLSVNNGQWTVTGEVDPDETLNLIISLACRGKKQEDIGAFIGLQQYQVSRLLKKAEKLGLITRNGRTVRRVK